MAKTLRYVALGVAAVVAVGYLQNHGAASGEGHGGGPARFVKPVDGTFTSGYGERWGEMHGGIDIAAPTGTPIRAVTRGTVIEAGPATGFGLWLRLRHDKDGTVTVYGHMHTLNAAAGDHVKAGETIATVGQRGQSTGPHLHLEVWPHGNRAARVDPRPWLADRGIRY
jgi:murein DD-endopeptidase MepM/ murein hydrolase activator NlpD